MVLESQNRSLNEKQNHSLNKNEMSDMGAFNDVLFDAKKLINEISPAAWGQGFDSPSGYEHGSGISLARVIDCLKTAKRAPSPDEGYIKSSNRAIFLDLVRLTLTKNPKCKTPNDIRVALGNTYDANGHHLSTGEKVLIKTLWDLEGDDDKFLFYLLFQERIDHLLDVLSERPAAKEK